MYKVCGSCGYCDHNRKLGEMVRCKRFSKWVEPMNEPCKDHQDAFLKMLLEVDHAERYDS